MAATLRDVLAIFDGAALVTCPWCHGSAFREAGSDIVCARCHPAPADAIIRADIGIRGPSTWRAPRTTTERTLSREVVWGVSRRRRGEEG